MIDAIITASPGGRVLDVGIGTGISARPFQQAVCQVLGVDPDERMARLAHDSGLDVEIAKFEEWDPAGRTFDVVIAGQAWHWVDPVPGGSKAGKLLRAGGRLALFWNVFQPTPDISEAFNAIYAGVLNGFGNFWTAPLEAYSTGLTKVADGITQSPAFDDPEQWRFDWECYYTTEQWLDTVPTFGGHSQIAPEKLAELLASMGHRIDAAGGSFTMGYTTVVVTATRTDAH